MGFFLSSTLFALCIETKINIVNQNKGKISLQNLPMGHYELTFWIISNKNSGKQKRKITMKEIIQSGDG